jgi:predicted glutamine amidotransferase
MCELMGLSFDQPVSADFSLRAFACRDAENPDGWGLAWYPDQSLALVKEALTWRRSGYSQFLENYQGLRAKIYLGHVRRQTTGGPATYADTHPFSREYLGREFCFAHNGTITDFAALHLGRFRPIGTTDSERVFCHLLGAMEQRGERLTDEAGWRWLWAALAEINQRGTLNCLLSDGQRLFAYRDQHGWKGLALRKLRFHQPGQRVFEDSMTGVAVAGNPENRGCLVATRPLSATGWHELALGSLVVLEGGAIRFKSGA